MNCPQCLVDLEPSARRCPCCGKSFLGRYIGAEDRALRRALVTARSARHRTSRRDGAGLDWREAAAGVLVGSFVFFAVLAHSGWPPFGTAAPAPQLAAPTTQPPEAIQLAKDPSTS